MKLSWALVAGAGATMHVMVLELPYARRWEPRPQGHVAVSELPRALVAGAGAMRHAAALELPCARRWEPRDMRACAPVLSFIFDLKLIRGGTRSLR
jgi:hypothetical protein